MAKKSLRRPVRYEKDQIGCIWGLISIFDFRQGRSTRKLLSDRRRGSRHAVGAGHSRIKLNTLTNSEEKCKRIKDAEERETSKADAMKTSVKELMEEEMFNEEGSKKQTTSDSEHGGRVRRKHKRTNDFHSKSCDLNTFDVDAARNVEPEISDHRVAEQRNSNNLDLIMEEFCHQIKSTSCVKHDWPDDLDMQSSQAYSVFEEKLSQAIKVLIDHRFTNGEHGKTHDYEEFVNALETLNLNKDFFLKSLENPNSPLLNHIQEVEDARLEKDQNSNSGLDKLVNHKRRNFFRRKTKPQETNPFKGIETHLPSNQIVILKPVPGGLQSHGTMENKSQTDRNASQFSFTEIKRKLKHAMGKERDDISRDDIIRRFPYEHQNLGEKGIGGENSGWSSPNRNHFYTDRFSVKRKDKIGKSKGSGLGMGNETTEYSIQGVSNIYIEAKKHLLEMLSNGDKDAELMGGQLPKSLGRVLSLPEYNFSPSCSPGKDREQSFVTAQMRLSSRSNFQMVNENEQHLIQENHTIHLDSLCKNPDEKVQSLDSNSDVSCELDDKKSAQETPSSDRYEMSSEEGEEIVKVGTRNQEDIKLLDVVDEPNETLITKDAQNCDSADVCDEAPCLNLDFVEDQFSSPLASPSDCSVIWKVEDSESTINRTERPSPISVLEPLFTEDDISPASSISRSVESVIQPQQIHFEELGSPVTDQGIYIRTCMEDEESAFEYVEAVLLGSGLNWDEFLSRWLSSDQILDPSLFDEVQLFSNRSCHDQELLFDCTNEVLKEVCEHYFGCFYRISFVKQNIRPVPKGMNLICEVWEGVEWHLLQQPHPSSLDQLVRKDMAKSGEWMDLRLDTEHVAIEMGVTMFEELVEDILLSFVNDSLEVE